MKYGVIAGILAGLIATGYWASKPPKSSSTFHEMNLLPQPAPPPSNFVTNHFKVGWENRSNIAGVFLYIGTNSGSYQVRITTTTNPMPITLVRKRDATNFIAATAVDALGVESDYSKEITFPYEYQWLEISWPSTQTVTLQFSSNLLSFQDFTNVTGTGITFDIPQSQSGMFRAINRSSTNGLKLIIEPK